MCTGPKRHVTPHLKQLASTIYLCWTMTEVGTLYDNLSAFQVVVEPEERQPTFTPRVSVIFTIPGGTVRAHTSDRIGLVGMTVAVQHSFWSDADLQGVAGAAFKCPVVAECDRIFLHPDGMRTITYLSSISSSSFLSKGMLSSSHASPNDSVLSLCAGQWVPTHPPVWDVFNSYVLSHLILKLSSFMAGSRQPAAQVSSTFSSVKLFSSVTHPRAS